MPTDNFAVMAFLIGTGVVVAGVGIAQTDWRHRLLIGGLIGIGVLLIIAGLGWPWIGAGLPRFAGVVATVALHPAAWAFTLILLGTAHLILRSRSIRRVHQSGVSDEPKSAAGSSANPGNNQPMSSPVAVKTHPHDIPKKLTVIDEQIIPLLRDEGEIELHLRRGRELLNNWKHATGPERSQYLEELRDYQRVSANLFDRLYRIQQAKPYFEDISALLDIGNSPYNINETYAHGLADFCAALKAFGDPPYNNMNHTFFMDGGRVQMFSSGLANYGAWRHNTEKAFTELRKQIASGEA